LGFAGTNFISADSLLPNRPAFWECNEEFKCQTYPNDLRANGDFRNVPRMMAQSFEHANLHVQWNGVFEDYCKRSLTREGDKLIALSGIAKAFNPE
jgi:hypothetical protein